MWSRRRWVVNKRRGDVPVIEIWQTDHAHLLSIQHLTPGSLPWGQTLTSPANAPRRSKEQRRSAPRIGLPDISRVSGAGSAGLSVISIERLTGR